MHLSCLQPKPATDSHPSNTLQHSPPRSFPDLSALLFYSENYRNRKTSLWKSTNSSEDEEEHPLCLAVAPSSSNDIENQTGAILPKKRAVTVPRNQDDATEEIVSQNESNGTYSCYEKFHQTWSKLMRFCWIYLGKSDSCTCLKTQNTDRLYPIFPTTKTNILSPHPFKVKPQEAPFVSSAQASHR